MMKPFLAFLLAGAMFATPALAQDTQPSPPSPPPSPPAASDQPEPPLPPGHPPMPKDAMRDDRGPRGPGGMRHPPPPEQAGHIRVKLGQGVEIDIKCDEDGPFRECMDAAMTMLNRVGQMQQGQSQGRNYDEYNRGYHRRGDDQRYDNSY
jgi:hypothetical protein